MIEGWKTHLKMKRKIGLESALFKLMFEGWKTYSMRENRAEKRTIFVDGRGLENALNDED